MFTSEQLVEAKESYHSLIHWLLIYMEENYDKDNLEKYFKTVLFRLDGLNELLEHPLGMMELIGNIRAAQNFVFQDDYNFGDYRKLILDQHTLLDKCFGGVTDGLS